MELSVAFGGAVSFCFVGSNIACLVSRATSVRCFVLLPDPSIRVHTTLIAISRLKLSESSFCDAGASQTVPQFHKKFES